MGCCEAFPAGVQESKTESIPFASNARHSASGAALRSRAIFGGKGDALRTRLAYLICARFRRSAKIIFKPNDIVFA